MTELQNKERVLLSYLCNKYNIEVDSALYKAAFLVLQRLWQGSICISLNDLQKYIDGFNVKYLTESMAVGKEKESRPLIFYKDNLYIQRYFIYQTRIIKKIENLEKNGKLHIITGGPGTGKTTSLAKLLEPDLDKKILLAAPTGKAAARMTESLTRQGISLQAKTIHRLLGYIYLSVNFKHNNENPLDADIIAIDECSMIDIPLMAKLLDAIPENCHLYLLGDKNQLSPVEAGTVFADICEKYKNIENENIYKELKKVYRTESQEIIEFSKMILDGTLQTLQNNKIKYNNQLSINELFKEYNALLNASNENDALDSLGEFQILCAIKNGRNGTKKINKELLEKAKKEKSLFTPIIITENNYAQNLFNGDVGIKNKEMAFFTGEKQNKNEKEIRQFPLSSLPGYEDAFAITIHKSQGSEYNKVAIVYPDSKKSDEDEEESIFTRELLYTAITRAKKECLIYGSQEILLESCKRKVNRASGIT